MRRVCNAMRRLCDAMRRMFDGDHFPATMASQF